jgi:C_GCAxxG_C_C family probable redox protein
MDSVERAALSFKEGFNCAQAVLSAYGPELGLNRELALKVAGAFGGGMGRQGETCGAVTGAFMAIGLKCGVAKADEEAKEKTYRLVKEFTEAFKARNGSTICRELLGLDIGTVEGRKKATEKKLFTTLCPKLVRDAAEIIGQMLREPSSSS